MSMIEPKRTGMVAIYPKNNSSFVHQGRAPFEINEFSGIFILMKAATSTHNPKLPARIYPWSMGASTPLAKRKK